MSTRKRANNEQSLNDNAPVRPSPFRRAIAWITLIAYIGQPLVVTAEVIADQAAAPNNRPLVDVTANGLPLVQIAPPSAAGVSHNQYTQFNVGPEGIILNNGQTTSLTQQAGYVGANPNLVNGSARIILNEVTSTSRSQLNGYTEVAGQQAEVIIANPNGITCNGCGFINTSRGVLTTGAPVFGAGGSLDYFRVTGGDIQIGSGGLNGSNVSQLDIITRSVQVNGELWANNLNVITGANQVDYNTLGVQLIPGTGTQPTVGIDVALLGGMYANKIRLIGTEAGVGVNSLGDIYAQTGDFTLDNVGQITLAGNTTAGGNIAITSATGIANSGTLYSQQNATLTSTTGSITNSDKLLSGGNITLNAASVNSTGALGSGIDVYGDATQNGNLTIITSGQTTATGTNIAGGSMSVNATSINLSNSQTSTGNGIDLNATAGNIDNSNGTLINMLGTTRLNASGNIINTNGKVGSGQDLDITASTISGNGRIVAGRDATIALQGNYTNAAGNVIKANRNLTLTTTGNFTNQTTLEAVGDLTLNAANLNNQAGALINANRTTLNIGAGTITNAARIEGNTVETHSNTFTNTSTVIGDVVNINATNINNLNAAAMIAATQSVNLIVTNALVNQDGASILSLIDINIGAGFVIDPLTGSVSPATTYLTGGNTASVTNSSASIEAWGNLRVAASTITNKRTVMGIEWGPTTTGAYVPGTASYSGNGTVQGTPSYTPSYKDQRFTAATTAAAQMLANGSMWFSGTALTNDYSDIIAGNAINATQLGTLNNNGAPLISREIQEGVQTSYLWGITGTSKCGTGGWSSCYNYGWVYQAPTPYYQEIDTDIADSVIHTGIKQEFGAPSLGTTSGNQTVTGSTVGSGTSTVTVPSGGLYTIQPQPGQNYLVATDPRFTSYGNFISSDYMLSRMALDPQTIQKRLGDGFYEQKLVLDQITAKTGRRYLGQYADANEQYIALLEAGADAATDFGIAPGVALTAEQINALKHDIVWLVDQEVKLTDGSIQHVLAPKVYLTRLHEADLRPNGALISADVIDLKLTEQKQPERADFVTITDGDMRHMPGFSKWPNRPNEGIVTIDDGARLNDRIPVEAKGWGRQAQEGIVTIDDGANLYTPGYSDPIARIAVPLERWSDVAGPMPVLLSNEDGGPRYVAQPALPDELSYKSFRKPVPVLQPIATGALTNTGTIRANRSLSIDAKDIVNRGGTLSSGGSLYLNASNDIRNQSGSINGRNVSLNAGRDIVSELLTDTISRGVGGSLQVAGFGRPGFSRPLQGSYTTTLIHGTAGITATEGLEINAGRDITLAASNINAGGNATINAGRDLNVRTVAKEESASNGSSISRSNTEQLTSSITTGGNLTLVSGNDMHLTSVAMEVGKDATLVAGGDLTLDASKNVSSSNVDTWVYKSRNFDETVVGTTLNAGGNVTLVATRLNTEKSEDEHSASNDASANSGDDDSDSTAGRTDGKGNITLNSATITSKKGDVAIMADANVNIGITEEKHESFSELNTETKSGTTTTKRTVRDEAWRTDTIGSSISGDNIKITSGRDINIEGSSVEAERNIDVGAMGSVNIVAATDTYGSEHYARERTTGLQVQHAFSITDQGPDITQKSRTDGTNQSENRSSLVSRNGNLNIMAGGDLVVLGSDLAAGPQPDQRGEDIAPRYETHGPETAYIQITDPNYEEGMSYAQMMGKDRGPSVGRIVKRQDSGKITLTAGGTVAMLAGQDTLSQSSSTLIVTNPNAFTKMRRTITDTFASLDYSGSTLQGESVKINAGNDIMLQATDVKAGRGGIELEAGNDILLLAAANTRSSSHQEKLATDGYTFRADGSLNDTDTRRMNNKFESQTVTNQVVSLVSGGDIKTRSGRNTRIEASVLEAQGAIDLNAGREATYNEDGTIKTEAVKGDIIFAAVKDSTYYSIEDSQNSMPWQSSTGKGEMKETLKLANIKAGNGLSVNATGEIIVDIPEVPAEAPVPEEPEVVEVEEPMPTHGADGKPLSQEELDAIAAERAAKAAAKAAEKAEKAIKAAEEKRIRDEQRFTDHINQLAGKSGQEWIGQLAKQAKEQPDHVKLQQVNAAMQHWDYAHEGLTGEASAVIAIVVTYFTAGAGSGVVGSATGTAVTAGSSTTILVASAVTQAAITTLATQATLSLINNKGDVGKTLDDMGKSENVKALVTSMITAGILSGISQTMTLADGTKLSSITAKSDFMDVLQKNVINNTASTIVNHAMYGGDLQQQLEQSLKNALIDTGAAKAANWIGDKKQDKTFNNVTHKLAHALAGCALGAAKANDCSSGALGAVVGEITAELYSPDSTAGMTQEQIAEMKTNTINFSKLMAGVAAALTGGDAAAINLASATAGNAVENNRMLHLVEIDKIKALKKEFADANNISIEEAEQRLMAQALRDTDKTFHDAHAITDVTAQNYLRLNASGFTDANGNQMLTFAAGPKEFYENANMYSETTQIFSKEYAKVFANTPQLSQSDKTRELYVKTAKAIAYGSGKGLVNTPPAMVNGVLSTAALLPLVPEAQVEMWWDYANETEALVGKDTQTLLFTAWGTAGALRGGMVSGSAGVVDETVVTGGGSLKNGSGSTSNAANSARNQPYGNGSSASPSPGPNAAGSSGASVNVPLMSRPDFYVAADGTAVPATGYRAVGGPAVDEIASGWISPRNPATYVTFDDISNLRSGSVQDLLQLQRTPSHWVSFDTLQIMGDLRIPMGRWNTTTIPEPFAVTFPEYGINGGGTQAITNIPIRINGSGALPGSNH